jgi:hypothetical protein
MAGGSGSDPDDASAGACPLRAVSRPADARPAQRLPAVTDAGLGAPRRPRQPRELRDRHFGNLYYPRVGLTPFLARLAETSAPGWGCRPGVTGGLARSVGVGLANCVEPAAVLGAPSAPGRPSAAAGELPDWIRSAVTARPERTTTASSATKRPARFAVLLHTTSRAVSLSAGDAASGAAGRHTFPSVPEGTA